MIESHSEQKIVECCIGLMQELVNEFEKYIDYIDIDLTELPDDEHFKVLVLPGDRTTDLHSHSQLNTLATWTTQQDN